MFSCGAGDWILSTYLRHWGRSDSRVGAAVVIGARAERGRWRFREETIGRFRRCLVEVSREGLRAAYRLLLFLAWRILVIYQTSVMLVSVPLRLAAVNDSTVGISESLKDGPNDGKRLLLAPRPVARLWLLKVNNGDSAKRHGPKYFLSQFQHSGISGRFLLSSGFPCPRKLDSGVRCGAKVEFREASRVGETLSFLKEGSTTLLVRKLLQSGQDVGRGHLHVTGTGFIILQLCTIRVLALLVIFSHRIILPLQSVLQ